MQIFRTLAILLTSLFISATTLEASGAANGFSQPSLISLTTLPHVAQDEPKANDPAFQCEATVGMIITEEAYKAVEAAGGFIQDYQHEKFDAVLTVMVEDYGPPPFEADEFVFAQISSDNPMIYVFAFNHGCLASQFPTDRATYDKIVSKAFGLPI